MVFVGFGGMGVWQSMGAPSIHNMSSLSQVMHVHVLGRHVHHINSYGIVMSSVYKSGGALIAKSVDPHGCTKRGIGCA